MCETDGSKTSVLHRNLLHVVNDVPADLPPAATKTTTSTKGRGQKRSSIRVSKKQPDQVIPTQYQSCLRLRHQNNQNSAEKILTCNLHPWNDQQPVEQVLTLDL